MSMRLCSVLLVEDRHPRKFEVFRIAFHWIPHQMRPARNGSFEEIGEDTGPSDRIGVIGATTPQILSKDL